MTHPPKIAYLTGQYPEVSLTFILREVDALRALGADVKTISIRRTPPEQHPGPAEKQAAATTFHVLEQAKNPARLLAAQAYLFTRPRRYLAALRLAWKTRSPGVKATLYQLVYFLEATILARYLEQEKIDHLHNHFVFGAATVAMLQKELTGIPYSFMLHGPADLFEPYRWALSEKAARARFVTVISHFARSQLMFFSDPKHWSKYHIIHCGVTPDRYSDLEVKREDDKIRLVFVGRLAPVKGLRVLFKVLEDLRDDIPNLRMTVVGDGPDRARLEKAAKDLGGMVHFTGYMSQDEVAQTLAASDICVLPSFAEGVPVILMEAFAAGLPVIATQVAGVGELVVDGESGYLVPPGDENALASRIRDLASNPGLRKSMGETGRNKVMADFDITHEADRLLQLFKTAETLPTRPGISPAVSREKPDPPDAA